MSKRIALLGASGFVGSAVREALGDQTGDGVEVVPVVAPRLRSASRTATDLHTEARGVPELTTLTAALAGCDVVVNAAGNPDASSLDEDALYGANALLPAVLLLAAESAGVRRVVHVSSAVVQNDKPVLDDSEDLRP